MLPDIRKNYGSGRANQILDILDNDTRANLFDKLHIKSTISKK